MNKITEIDIKSIMAGDNDRTIFSADALADLATSIKEHGLIQPITVRTIDTTGKDPLYMIVAGERRFRACQILGHATIHAIIADFTDEEASAVMLSENIARQELDPIDEGIAYQKRIASYGWTVQDCASKAGVSEIRVQFRIKLLRLRPDIQQLVRTGNIPMGYAQIIAGANLDANFQLQAAAALRDNSAPTLGWFRKVCAELAGKQSQVSLFNAPLFGGQYIDNTPKACSVATPPHPSTSKPPKTNGTIKDIIKFQISFWETAAEAWNEIGKPFKRQECQSASQALQLVLTNI